VKLSELIDMIKDAAADDVEVVGYNHGGELNVFYSEADGRLYIEELD
jgi:hypothetical protein